MPAVMMAAPPRILHERLPAAGRLIHEFQLRKRLRRLRGLRQALEGERETGQCYDLSDLPHTGPL
jgi:hypothetical protein